MHMKKYVGVFLVIMIFGTALWTTLPIQNNPDTKTVSTKIIHEDLAPDAWANINNIRLRFCNQLEDKNILTTELVAQTRPWQRQEICMVIGNSSDKDENISLGFVQGKIDDQWSMSCDNNTQDNSFAKAIAYKPITGITIPASGSIIQKVTYKASKNMSGEILGCVTYKSNDTPSTTASENMFIVVVRKIAPIYINITGDRYYFWWIDNIKDMYTHHKVLILRSIIGLLSLWILITLIQMVLPKKSSTKKAN